MYVRLRKEGAVGHVRSSFSRQRFAAMERKKIFWDIFDYGGAGLFFFFLISFLKETFSSIPYVFIFF